MEHDRTQNMGCPQTLDPKPYVYLQLAVRWSLYLLLKVRCRGLSESPATAADGLSCTVLDASCGVQEGV